MRETIATAPGFWLTTGGFLIGLAFGALLSRTNYCMMGAISDARLGIGRTRLGAAALAAATAIVAAQALDAALVTNLAGSIYLTPRLNWLGAIVGGLMFGAGMVYAGGCPSRGLVRSAAGDIRALVTLIVMSIAALATLSGIFAEARVALDRTTGIDLRAAGLGSQSLNAAITAAGIDPSSARIIAAALVVAPLVAFAVVGCRVLGSPRDVVGGIGAGLLVTAGWVLTGLAHDDMSLMPVQAASMSFVKPVADAIDWIERATALGWPGFQAAAVFGVAVGAFAASAAASRLAFNGFADRADLMRHVFGGIAMGVGGILAMGCTIGQGVTGISTLSLQSFVAVGAIIAGALMALSRLEDSL